MQALIRRSFDHHIVLAIGLAVIIFFGSLFGLALFVDGVARDREQAQVRHAVEAQVRGLEALFPGQLDWDEAVANLDNRFDQSWAATNVGHYFSDTLHFDFVYVLDAQNAPVYAMRASAAVDVESFASLHNATLPMVRSIRAQETRRGPFVPPFRSGNGDISVPIQASTLTRIGPTIYVLTGTLVQPNNGQVLPLGPRSVIVITGKPVDHAFLQPISEDLLISNLRLMEPGANAGASVPLLGDHGETLATLGWTPSRPGVYLVSIAFLPILLAVCLPLGLYFNGRRMARKLGSAMRELEDVAASVPGVIFTFRRNRDGTAGFPFASPAIEDVAGLRQIDVARDNAAFTSRVHPDDLRWLNRQMARSARNLSPWRGELRYRHPRKGERWIEVNCRPRSGPDRTMVWHGFAADVTERRVAETALRNAAAALANTGEGVVVTDLDGTVTSVNPAFTNVTGFSEAEVLGQNMRLVRSDRYDRSFFEAMWQALLTKGSWQGEIWNKRKDGTHHPKWVTISAVQDRKGKAVGYVGTLTDISELKATESRLQELATHDVLTGLPNRIVLQSRLEHALARSRRQAFSGAVLFLDLDRFKNVNDSLGHAAGDQVLRTVGRRLKTWLREMDTLTRIGGDEFVILLEDLPSSEYVAHVARALIDQVLKPVLLNEGQEIYISTSIGISLFPGDGETPEELIRNADAALYRAKEEGRGNFRFFTEELTQFASARLDLEARLRRAIHRQEFVLYYQPIYSLEGRKVKGVEALVRWVDPERGLIEPVEFIALAEETGLIVALGNWVLRNACSQIRLWCDRGLALGPVSVNLSPVQFLHGNIVNQIQKALDETGVPGEALQIEITEGALMQAASGAETKLKALRALGVRVSIDDFGTGYSSLSYLKRFPIDTLKIDQGFVRGIASDPTDRQIVIALVSLANSLRFDAVAEGIETEEQVAFLAAQGCRSGQGFLFGHPVLPASIEALVAEDQSLTIE